MTADLRAAILRLNDAAHEALRAARNEPDAAGYAAILRSIASRTDTMVDETAPNAEGTP